jgi:hypothetical protein
MFLDVTICKYPDKFDMRIYLEISRASYNSYTLLNENFTIPKTTAITVGGKIKGSEDKINNFFADILSIQRRLKEYGDEEIKENILNLARSGRWNLVETSLLSIYKK